MGETFERLTDFAKSEEKARLKAELEAARAVYCPTLSPEVEAAVKRIELFIARGGAFANAPVRADLRLLIDQVR